MAKVTFSSAGDTLVAYLSGEIDHHSAQYLRDEIDSVLQSRMPQTLVLDFSAVSFMDSSGVGVLLSCYKQMAASRGSTAYYGAGPQVQRILAIAGIERLMNGYAGKEEALRGGRE